MAGIGFQEKTMGAGLVETLNAQLNRFGDGRDSNEARRQLLNLLGAKMEFCVIVTAHVDCGQILFIGCNTVYWFSVTTSLSPHGMVCYKAIEPASVGSTSVINASHQDRPCAINWNSHFEG